MKINCIIQAVFGCLQILEQSLVTESQRIMRIGERITKCLAEYLETKGDCYSALLSALILSKCFHTRLWENTPFVSRQLSGIGSAFSSALVNAGKTTFKDILKTNPREIERIIHRKAPMGNTIQDQVAHLPDYELFFEDVLHENNLTVKLIIRLNNADILKVKSSVNVNSCMNLLVGDTNNNIISYEKQLHSHFIENPETVKTFDFPKDYEGQIMAHLISEDWVGFDCNVNFVPSNAKKCTNNNKKQEVPKKREITKPRQNKQPSHIQTFMDTYFKTSKPKNQRKKSETAIKSSTKPRIPKINPISNSNVFKNCTTTKPKNPNDNEENISSTSVTNQEPVNLLTEPKEHQPNEENITSTSFIEQADVHFFDDINIDRLLSSNKTNFVNAPKEDATTAKNHPISSTEDQNDSILQSLIDNSIKEYKKQTDNKSHNNIHSNTPLKYDKGNKHKMTFLPKELNTTNTSLVYSDEFFATARRNNTSDLTQQIDEIPESMFKFTQQVPVKEKRKFRLGKNMNCSINFENSLSGVSFKKSENCTPKEFIHLNFKHTPSKRYRHDPSPPQRPKVADYLNVLFDSDTSSIENDIKTPEKKVKHGDEIGFKIQNFLTPNIQKRRTSDIAAKPNENLQKTLTWRSPLITSPITKYSPNLDNKCIRIGENMSSSVSRPNKSDVTPFRENKSNIRFSISVNNDPLETSTSTSDANSTLKASSLSRPTLKRNMFKSPNTTLLSDQAYLQSLNQTNETLTNAKNNSRAGDELVSTSFLESLGLFQKQSQQKTDKHSQEVKPQVQNLKGRKETTVTDYYSRVIKDTKVKEAGPGLTNRENVKVKNSDVKDCNPPVIASKNRNSGVFQDNCKNLPFMDDHSGDNIEKSKENDLFDITFDFDMDTTVIPQMFGPDIHNISNDRFSNNSLKFGDEQNIFDRKQVKSVFEAPCRRICGRQLTPKDVHLLRPHHGHYNKSFAVPQEPKQISHYYKEQYYSPQDEEIEDHCQCHKCLEKPWKSQALNFSNRMYDCYDHNPSFCRAPQFGCYREAGKSTIRPSMTQNLPFHRSQIDSAEVKKCCNKSLHRNSFSSYSDLNNYAFENIKRPRVPTFQRIPSLQKRCSFHNLDDACSVTHHYNSCHADLPKYYPPDSRFVENEMIYFPGNSKGDKQYVLRRYLDSVEDKQMRVSSEGISRNFDMSRSNNLDFTICPDEMDDI
ncbi:hypothetical protein ILUMI_02218 [Ignelater luminosus]|uniref:SEC63 domain-containing protein n=1 Tax=Ignelater luminosus TaxID=2038154 RepID=A0A8K0DGU6_IGNLU|nr:hypothetical protein ILUMI_02218 [Ignelater luminosus]